VLTHFGAHNEIFTMHNLDFIIWNFDPELYNFLGKYPIRWYGLLFALGFLISQQVLFYIYKKESDGTIEAKRNAEQMVENMTIYMIIATIVGARLGHVLFYQPQDYFTSFEGLVRILNIREGGLASHGAGIGIFLIMLLYTHYRFNVKEGKFSKLFFLKTNRGYTYFQIMDRLAIVVALTGALIRMGNFANSEIIGIPTDSNNGVVFARELTDYLEFDATGSGWIEDVSYNKVPEGINNDNGNVPIFIYIEFKNRRFEESRIISLLDNGINSKLARMKEHIDEPISHNLDYQLNLSNDGVYLAQISTFAVSRHPAQLYESITTFISFLILFYIWSRKKKETMPGLLFGLFIIYLFIARFFHEFIKENQVSFEDNLTLNMGQWLSIPMVIFGILILILAYKSHNSQGTGS
jgi:phosphatidylglycerol:prolipoprotein diacylglycerol transferase